MDRDRVACVPGEGGCQVEAEFEQAAGIAAQGRAVAPELGVRMDAADIEPDAVAMPSGRDLTLRAYQPVPW